VGDAIELPIERNKLVDPESQPIKGAEYVDDLMKYLQRKIYVVNCGHACTGFIGYHNGCPTIQETLARPELKEQIRNIALESAAAIEAEYGFAHDDMVRYVDSMIIKRYTTPGISDPVGRVCREPLRKLSANDRLMGTGHPGGQARHPHADPALRHRLRPPLRRPRTMNRPWPCSR